jgi:hypothetical protein
VTETARLIVGILFVFVSVSGLTVSLRDRVDPSPRLHTMDAIHRRLRIATWSDRSYKIVERLFSAFLGVAGVVLLASIIL